MANIKSAEKRISVNEKKYEQNKAKRSKINNTVKKFNKAAESGKTELAATLQTEATSQLDKGANKNVIHKNKANRLKSRMAKKVANPDAAKASTPKKTAAKKAPAKKLVATKKK